MASTTGITSGSPLCGSPIYIGITSGDISSVTDATFHRVVLRITAGIETSFKTFLMSHQCQNNEQMNIDISSALRVVGEQYTYTPNAATYPIVKWNVEIWDEYLKDGELKTTSSVFYPASGQYYRAILGAYSSLDRILSSGIKRVYDLCRKPTTSPQIVRVGETFAYTPSLVLPKDYQYDGYGFDDLIAPQSNIYSIISEGEQQWGDVKVYALPASDSEDNYEFRFINRLGVLDSFSVHSFRETSMALTSEEYTLANNNSFSSFENETMRKQGDYETWELSSGPLDYDWQQWFMHEFLLAEHVWMFFPTGRDSNGKIIHGGSADVEGKWLRVHIIADDSVAGVNRVSPTLLEIPFSVKLDFDGSPSLTL